MEKDLKKLRTLIDEIDESIVRLLASRQDLVTQVALVKKDLGIQILDSKREKDLLSSLKEKSKKYGISEGLIDSVYEAILKNSKAYQKTVKEKNTKEKDSKKDIDKRQKK